MLQTLSLQKEWIQSFPLILYSDSLYSYITRVGKHKHLRQQFGIDNNIQDKVKAKDKDIFFYYSFIIQIKMRPSHKKRGGGKQIFTFKKQMRCVKLIHTKE